MARPEAETYAPTTFEDGGKRGGFRAGGFGGLATGAAVCRKKTPAVTARPIAPATAMRRTVVSAANTAIRRCQPCAGGVGANQGESATRPTRPPASARLHQ